MAGVEFLSCPQCQGYGYNITAGGQPVRCSVCKDHQSILGFVDDDIVYWDHAITTSTILEQQTERLVNNVIHFILLILGLGGLVALMTAVYAQITHHLPVISAFDIPSQSGLIFWLSVIADLVLYYRLERLSEAIPVIRPENKMRGFTVQGDATDWRYWASIAKSRKIDAYQHVDEAGRMMLVKAYRKAEQLHHKEIRPVHLLLALLESPAISAMFYRLEMNVRDVVVSLRHVAEKGEKSSPLESTREIGADLRKAFLYSYVEARRHKRPRVGQVELLIGSILADQLIQDVLYDRNVNMEKVRNLVRWSHIVDDVLAAEKRRRHLARGKPKGIMNRAMTARETKALDAVSQDLTLMAKANAFLPPIGRDAEIEEAFRVLQQGYSSVLLVGPSGVGKTTIMQGIAERMTAENVPGPLQDKRLVVSDAGSIIAGASGLGGLEKRMQDILNDILISGNILWGIEDIHALLGAGSTRSTVDIGKIMMNYISQGYIRVIGTTTTKEFNELIRPQETFLRRFQVVQIPELNPQDSIAVLEGRSPYVEAEHNVFFTYDALEACAVLSDRFIKDRHLPAKAVDVMNEAAVLAKESMPAPALVTKAIVEQVMSEKTNVSLNAISENEAAVLLNLETILHQRVIGQDAALTAIARALRRARQDLRDTKRPIASLLFLGPTGVGKTETAKTIAEVYFGNEANMMRFDMSEYGEAASMEKLIGAAGHTGHLIDAVRQTPFGIVLLDEFEKAHDDIRNLFLQVMEDGRLTDGNGQVADFTNTMIIATSNAGTAQIQQLFQTGHTSAAIKEQLLSGNLLRDYFRLELLNRFDDITIFTPLNTVQLEQVCGLLLKRLAGQLQTKGITLRWTAEAAKDFVQQGYDPEFGARPLRRLIQDTTEDAIAKLLLEKKIGRRDIVELQAGGKVRVIKAEQL